MSQSLQKIVLNGIQKEIDENTQSFKQPDLGDKKLQIVYPYAVDFLKTFEKREIVPILQHSFFQWLNSHRCFVDAYDLMLNNRLISQRDKETTSFAMLEIIIANTISYLIGAKFIYGDKKMRRAIVPSKERADKVTRSLKNLRGSLRLHAGLYCRIESKQYLLQELIEDILKDQSDFYRNVYSSGTTNQQLIRTLITKRIMHGLYSPWPNIKKNPEPRLIAHIALKVSEVFFNPMDISDATDLAKEVQENVIEDEKFKNQTIQDYLFRSISKG